MKKSEYIKLVNYRYNEYDKKDNRYIDPEYVNDLFMIIEESTRTILGDDVHGFVWDWIYERFPYVLNGDNKIELNSIDDVVNYLLLVGDIDE